MNACTRKMDAHTPSYPQTVEEWRAAIAQGLGLAPEEGQRRYQAHTFPLNTLAVWIEREFSADKGYHADFVPALTRNIKGLIAWVYGNGSEPHWPGQDEDEHRNHATTE